MLIALKETLYGTISTHSSESADDCIPNTPGYHKPRRHLLLFLLQMLLVGNSFKITGFVLNVQYTDKSLIR